MTQGKMGRSRGVQPRRDHHTTFHVTNVITIKTRCPRCHTMGLQVSPDTDDVESAQLEFELDMAEHCPRAFFVDDTTMSLVPDPQLADAAAGDTNTITREEDVDETQASFVLDWDAPVGDGSCPGSGDDQ